MMKYVFLIIPLYVAWGIKRKEKDIAFFILCALAFCMGLSLLIFDGVYLAEIILGGQL